MNPFRRLLRYFLGNLARRAIKKHNLELIVITGYYGTGLARDMLFTILNDKLRVRKNNKEIWWDFSIPLAILGYKDYRRSPFQWAILLVRATLLLSFGRANPHILILNADCTYKMTAEYWASFIKPEYLLILNYEKEAEIVNQLLNSTDKERGTVIYNPDRNKFDLKDRRSFTYGESALAKVQVKKLKDRLRISYNKQYVSLPTSYLPSFSVDMLGGVFAVAILKGLDLTEAGFNSLKFELPAEIVNKIRSNLDFKGLQ
jgi:UDP-N-acetylmuramyl pentapeptide synthase